MGITDPVKRAEYMREYRAKNHERIRERDRIAERKYYENNKEKIQENQRAHRAKNIDRYREYNARWHRENRAKNPKKVRDMHLRSSYGITLEEFGKLLVAQNGKCGVCGTETPGGTGWHLDHSHTTGGVRGILCTKCNTGGGLFNDDPDLLRKAVEWFSKP